MIRERTERKTAVYEDGEWNMTSKDFRLQKEWRVKEKQREDSERCEDLPQATSMVDLRSVLEGRT